MTQKTQYIVLGVLLAALAGVAAYVLWPKNEPPPRPQAAGAPNAPAGNAPAAAAAQASATATTQAPTVEELKDLATWFAIQNDVAPTQTRPVLGLEQKPAVAPPPDMTPAPAASFNAPPQLEGIIGNAAVYMGEAYKAGEKVRGTGFKVVEVGDGFVWIIRDDGTRIRQLWQN